MLGLQQLIEAQKAGEQSLAGLGEDEKTILQQYSYMAAGELLKVGAQNRAPVNEIVMNAMRLGLSLGSQIEMDNGAVSRRGK